MAQQQDTRPRTAAPAPAAEQPRRYFIVNPAGAIHEVDREHARWRLAQPGWRVATPDEIAALAERSGLQVHDRPIAPRWSPDPDAQLDALGA